MWVGFLSFYKEQTSGLVEVLLVVWWRYYNIYSRESELFRVWFKETDFEYLIVDIPLVNHSDVLRNVHIYNPPHRH